MIITEYYAGQWVNHGRFGLGVIEKLDGDRALVRFGQTGRLFDLGSGKLDPFDDSGRFSFEKEGIRYRRITGLDELEVVAFASGKDSAEIPRGFTINNREFSVSRIGTKAFAALPDLRSVSIPPSVTGIAPDAFACSDGIRQVRKVASNKETATLVVNSEGRWGALGNPAMKQDAIPLEYEEILFYAGKVSRNQKVPIYYFLVRKEGLWGLLNKFGRQQAPCVYDELRPCEEDGFLKGFAFRRNGQSGMVDGKGIETISA